MSTEDPIPAPFSNKPEQPLELTDDFAPGESNFIKVEDFKFFYGKKQALHGINLEIPSRKVTAFIGPSGCGKSTLLRNFNRMNELIPGVRHEGDITIHGTSIYDPSVEIIALRRRIGMVFQKSNPFPMSIYENIVYPLRIAGQKGADHGVEEGFHDRHCHPQHAAGESRFRIDRLFLSRKSHRI